MGTPEWDSFKNYVKAYYQECMKIAADVSGGFDQNERIYMAVFNATLSPLVFLWEKWQLMKSEQRLPYATPEYATILKKQMSQVEETVKRAEERGAFQEKGR
jgi:hypothetical protein